MDIYSFSDLLYALAKQETKFLNLTAYSTALLSEINILHKEVQKTE